MQGKGELVKTAVDLAVESFEDESSLSAETLALFKIFATRAVKNALYLQSKQIDYPSTTDSYSPSLSSERENSAFPELDENSTPPTPPPPSTSTDIILHPGLSDLSNRANDSMSYRMAFSLLTVQKFSTSEELVNRIKSLNYKEGYALVTKWSSQTDDARRITYLICLVCDRHGKPRPRGNGIRLSRSKKIDCPVTIALDLNQNTNFWTARPQQGEHNHQPDDIQSHPSARLLDPASYKLIDDASLSGGRPLEIHSTLLRRGEKVIRKDIYNRRQFIKLADLSNRTPTQATLQLLEAEQWTFHFATDNKSQLIRLFAVHPLSRTRLQQYPTVLIIDATYKVNRYKMPVIHVCGITATNKTFDVGFCFVKTEKTMVYLWFAEHLRALYDQLSLTPSLIVTDNDAALINAISRPHTFSSVKRVLCLWHIKQNVRVHLFREVKVTKGMPTVEIEKIEDLRKRFISDFWLTVVASDQAGYRSASSDLEAKYLDSLPHTVQYFWTFLHPLRLYWAYHLTHTSPLFGVEVTSRAESAHARLKQYIPRCTVDIYTSVKCVKRMIESCEPELGSSIAYDQANYPIHFCQDKIFSDGLFQHVSSAALRQFYRQVLYFRDKKNYRSQCSYLFEPSMGILCSHSIAQRISNDAAWKVTVGDFHSFWYFDPGLSGKNTRTRYCEVLDPAVGTEQRQEKFKSGTARHQTTSSKRCLSQFEVLEGEHASLVSASTASQKPKRSKSSRPDGADDYKQFVQVFSSKQ